jgi:hypothetical protein
LPERAAATVLVTVPTAVLVTLPTAVVAAPRAALALPAVALTLAGTGAFTGTFGGLVPAGESDPFEEDFPAPDCPDPAHEGFPDP